MRSRKRPCQPKTAKRFFGGPGSHGPSGQAKERTRILPVRRGSFCPACRAIWQAGRSCAASRCYAGFCARCLFFRSALFARVFSLVFHPSLPNFFLSNFFSFVAQAATGISLLVPFRDFVPSLRAAYLFLPDPCCRNLPAMCFVCAVLFCFGCLFACSTLFARAFFSYLSPFPVWLLPLKLLFICRSGRDGPLLSSEKKVDKDSRGALPLRTPFQRPVVNQPLSLAAGRLKRPFGPQTAGR